MEKTKRNPSVDLIRIVAVYCVISVHFFLNNGFYSANIEGSKMFWMTVLRNFFMICVPLFMILTGYLNGKKELKKGYFKGIGSIIGTYLLATFACLVFKHFALCQDFTLAEVIGGIQDFSIATYAWYINMYIGLFCLIPFLNIVYKNLPSKKDKLVLLMVMLFLTAAPHLTNSFNFTVEGWWRVPTLSQETFKILPTWWIGIYPITYYYIGCYIKEYDIKMKWYVNLFLIVFFALVFGAFNFWRSHNGGFVWGPYQNWGALPVLILAVLVFVFLLHLDLTKFPKWVQHKLAQLSKLCLGAYLVSYIFDCIFYDQLNSNVTSVPEKLPYYIQIVPWVFVYSMTLSCFLYGIQWILSRGFRELYQLFVNVKNGIKQK